MTGRSIVALLKRRATELSCLKVLCRAEQRGFPLPWGPQHHWELWRDQALLHHTPSILCPIPSTTTHSYPRSVQPQSSPSLATDMRHHPKQQGLGREPEKKLFCFFFSTNLRCALGRVMVQQATSSGHEPSVLFLLPLSKIKSKIKGTIKGNLDVS